MLSNKRVNGQLIGVPDAGDAWHSDLSFKPETAMYTFLQSVVLPSRGGDTEFINLQAAYAALPSATRRRIDKLKGIHSISKLRNPRVVISDQRDGADGQALLDDLFVHQLQPEFRYRHHWRSGDLVIWDNRSVNHRACGGYDDDDIRLMHRTTVLGDAPY